MSVSATITFKAPLTDLDDFQSLNWFCLPPTFTGATTASGLLVLITGCTLLAKWDPNRKNGPVYYNPNDPDSTDFSLVDGDWLGAKVTEDVDITFSGTHADITHVFYSEHPNMIGLPYFTNTPYWASNLLALVVGGTRVEYWDPVDGWKGFSGIHDVDFNLTPGMAVAVKVSQIARVTFGATL